MKKPIFIIFLSIIVFAVGAAGIYFLKINKSTNNANPDSDKVVSNSGSIALNSTDTRTSESNNLKVQGANTQKPSKNQLPLPEQFEVYEEYASSENAVYVDMQVGKGQEANNGSNVALLYKGWLTDGTLFDQSRKNQSGQYEPLVFQLGSGQVIPGFEQTVVGMKVGGQRRLIIPSSVGYGPNGQGSIPPNALLIFDVELVEVQ